MPKLSTPPALSSDELPEMVLAVNVKVPRLSMPPPLLAEALPETVQLVRVSVPSFSIAPPLPAEKPSVIVEPGDRRGHPAFNVQDLVKSAAVDAKVIRTRADDVDVAADRG